MKVFRIKISSWTASFRYPNIISGFQATLPVPPLSTIYGLISAAMGKLYAPPAPEIGFVFQASAKAIDLETIYQMGQSLKNVKSNVIRREFMAENRLWLYTQNPTIPEALAQPYFPVLLGRSGDLATIDEIKPVDVESLDRLNKLKGTIIPFGKYQLAAPIQSLPVTFFDEIPRRNQLIRPYFLLDSNYNQNQSIAAPGFFDEEENMEVYWQEI